MNKEEEERKAYLALRQALNQNEDVYEEAENQARKVMDRARKACSKADHKAEQIYMKRMEEIKGGD